MKKFINPKLKYFVYQHGGSYITRVDNSYQNETMTCDYFITWGDKTDITMNGPNVSCTELMGASFKSEWTCDFISS